MNTIKEVAKLSQVSISTVSRALSGKNCVQGSTREKILRVAAKLNYRPNPLAKGLKGGRTKTLALILPDITNPLYPRLVKSIEKRAAEQGNSLILFDTDGDRKQEEKYLEALNRHYVDGVLLISTSDQVGPAKKLIQGKMPMVLVNRDFPVGALCVTNDNHAGAYAVAEHLIGFGHRRIACLQVDLKMQRYRQRRDGCQAAFRKHGIKEYRKYLVPVSRGIEEAYNETRRLLAGKDRPTAFFAFIDIIAIGVYHAILDSGLRIPEDVSVAGFDNIEISRHLFPPLTTYEHPVDAIAKAAVAGLLEQIDNPEAGIPDALSLSGSIIVRKSTGEART